MQHEFSRANATNTRQRRLQGYACGILAALIWGGWPAVSKLGGLSLSPYDLLALRFGVAGLLLMPVFLRNRLTGISLPHAALLILGAGLPYMATMILGLSLAPAGHGGLIGPGSALLFTVAGSVLLLRERLSRGKLLCILALSCGMAIVGWNPAVEHQAGGSQWRGDLLFAVGGLLWASYSISVKRSGIGALHAASIVATGSMLIYLPAYCLLGLSSLHRTPWSDIVLQGGYQGVLTAILALILHTRAIRCLGAGSAALFPALVPVIAIATAYGLLGERPGQGAAAGIVLILFGMAMGMGWQQPRPGQEATLRSRT